MREASSVSTDYTNEEIIRRIDSLIHSERHRRALKRRYADRPTLEALAEEEGVDVSTVKRWIKRYKPVIFGITQTPDRR